MTLWAVPTGRAERLALAQSYPFDIPDASFLFRNGAAETLQDVPDLGGRTPVLAIGSNQSPVQLARKFAHAPETEIPVTRAWLDDYDICYATHVTRYGSIPGNLHHCENMRVRLSITWLDETQLRVMHATEIVGESYVYARLSGLGLETENGSRVDSALAYVSLHGVMRIDGAPLGLASMAAEGRPHCAAFQNEALAALHRRCGNQNAIEDFILAAIADPAERMRRTALLRSDPIRSDWPHLEIIEC
ncbi:MAG: hypothetical protein WEC00_08980 [Dongiaceae bacterium]